MFPSEATGDFKSMKTKQFFSKNTKTPLSILMWVVIVGALLLPNALVLAEEIQYVPLAPVRQFSSGVCDPSQPTSATNCQIKIIDYIPKVFKLTIAIAGALAVIMIMLGGIKYITSASMGGKEDGKEMITNAIMGLLLAIGAYIILYTINPETLKFNLSTISAIPPSSIVTPPGPPPGPGDSVMCPVVIGPRASPIITTVPCACSPVCVTLGTGIYAPISFRSAGVKLNKIIADKALELDRLLAVVGVSWSITEAWPPSFAHRSVCHQDGKCFDANINPPIVTALTPTASEVNRVNQFFTFSRASGLRPILEVKTQAEKDALYAAGVRSGFTISVNPGASAPHFHVI